MLLLLFFVSGYEWKTERVEEITGEEGSAIACNLLSRTCVLMFVLTDLCSLIHRHLCPHVFVLFVLLGSLVVTDLCTSELCIPIVYIKFVFTKRAKEFDQNNFMFYLLSFLPNQNKFIFSPSNHTKRAKHQQNILILISCSTFSPSYQTKTSS